MTNNIAPITALSYIQANNIIITMLISLSAIVGALLGMNQISLRILIAYSSINNIGWIMAALITNYSIWMCYIIVYSILIAYIFLLATWGYPHGGNSALIS